MAERAKLNSSYLVHRLAASLYRHVSLLQEPGSRPKIEITRDACFKVAKR